MSPVRLIAIDLDGTLLDKQGAVSPATLEAIKKAAETTLIVVATGRRTRKAIQLSSPLPFDHHLLSCSGAHVEHRPSGKHLLNRFFETDIIGRILRIFSSLEMGAVMFSPDCCGELTVMHGKRPAQHMETYLSRAADSIRGFADVGGSLPADVHFV
ncbi:MAG: HAD hydrolase family protein, partial [Candidatus Brocadiia bacterium]